MFGKWLDRRKERYNKMQFKNGYDFAAGRLLRGEETPMSLEAMQSFYGGPDHFDKGVDAAINKLVDLKLIIDDRVV